VKILGDFSGHLNGHLCRAHRSVARTSRSQSLLNRLCALLYAVRKSRFDAVPIAFEIDVLDLHLSAMVVPQ